MAVCSQVEKEKTQKVLSSAVVEYWYTYPELSMSFISIPLQMTFKEIPNDFSSLPTYSTMLRSPCPHGKYFPKATFPMYIMRDHISQLPIFRASKSVQMMRGRVANVETTIRLKIVEQSLVSMLLTIFIFSWLGPLNVVSRVSEANGLQILCNAASILAQQQVSYKVTTGCGMCQYEQWTLTIVVFFKQLRQ